jgi:hypothetical protein
LTEFYEVGFGVADMTGAAGIEMPVVVEGNGRLEGDGREGVKGE